MTCAANAGTRYLQQQCARASAQDLAKTFWVESVQCAFVTPHASVFGHSARTSKSTNSTVANIFSAGFLLLVLEHKISV
jgi:hypothetical protein